ncbi:hypothetical protein BX589_102337 [Paraburkholderia fungorum]|nr:hypothetical protein BX589_102337 [Paraburkholderia fungorum]
MYTGLDLCLVLLLGIWVGGSLGLIVGGINRSAKRADETDEFCVPAAHREFEHESDAPYPQIWD